MPVGYEEVAAPVYVAATVVQEAVPDPTRTVVLRRTPPVAEAPNAVERPTVATAATRKG